MVSKEEYTNTSFELSIKKEKGKQNSQITVIGEEDDIIVGICSLIDIALNKVKIEKDKVLAGIECALEKNEVVKPKKEITVKTITVDSDNAQELENLLRKITKGAN